MRIGLLLYIGMGVALLIDRPLPEFVVFVLLICALVAVLFLRARALAERGL